MLNSRTFKRFPIELAAVFTVAALLTLAAHPSVGLAQDATQPSSGPPAGPYNEEEAQGIDRMLMCPVCPAESIDQAQVELARQMRQKVRELLAEGYTRQEVLDYFEERYGPKVLAAPPKRGAHIWAWVLPIGSVLLGIAIGLVILRSMKRPSAANQAAGQQDDEDLQPYLEEIDRGLSLDDPTAAAGIPPTASGDESCPPLPGQQGGMGHSSQGERNG